MPDASPTPWAALLPATLAGTRRQTPPALPGLTPAPGTEAGAPEKQLLLTAANLALVQRAGQRFAGPAEGLPPAAAGENWPVVPAALARRLEKLVDDAPTDPATSFFLDPYATLLDVAVRDLHRLRHRLPRWLVLRLLRHPLGGRLEVDATRQVLGEWGRRLHQLLGPAYSPWYGKQLGWADFTPQRQLELLGHRLQKPLPAHQSYLPEFAALPAKKRTQLLWQAWQYTGGSHLPPTLQAELDALLAATPPAQRPWTTTYGSIQGLAGHPRLAGHPLLARMGEWAAPLLTLERPAGKPPRVRIELPTGGDKQWAEVGLRHDNTNKFYRDNKQELRLQERLYALGPRYWAERWQLPSAEVVALVGAARHGPLVLEAWLIALVTVTEVAWPEPEFVRALLAAQPRAWLRRRLFLLRHLPLAERLAGLAAMLPTSPTTLPERTWAEHLRYRILPLGEPAIVRTLLPALAFALAAPRTAATTEQSRDLPHLLHQLAELADPELLPEVQATLGAIVPERPAHAEARDLLLRGLTLRHDLRQACPAPTPTITAPAA